MRFPKTVFCAGLLCLVPVICVAQAPTEIEAVLALPASPGSDALLLPHAADPRVPQRWREALMDPSVARRAAAARLIGAAAARTTIGGLRAAAIAEKDPVALAEMLRALVIIGSEASDGLVYERLATLPPPAVRRIADVLTNLRPAGVVADLLAGGALSEDAEGVADIYARLLAIAPQEAIRLEQGPLGASPQVMAGMLRMARGTRRRMPAALLVAALRADAAAAGDALSYLGATYETSAKAATDTALADAYAAQRALQTPTSPLHGVLLALADRWLTREAPDASEAIASMDVQAFEALRLPQDALRGLTQVERRALAARLGREPDEKSARAAALDAIPRWSRWGDALLAPALVLSDVPGALALDVAKLTGCRASTKHMFGAMISHRADGRVHNAGLAGAPLSDGCLQMARLLLSAAYGSPPLPGSTPSRTIIRLDEAWWSCGGADAASMPGSPPLVAGTQRMLVPPKKIEDRKPQYPPDALAKAVHGVVVIDTNITSSGCVSDAKVVRSIPLLDLSALVAVSHWRYTPVKIDGVAAPTNMTVTVSFSLR